MNNIIRWLDCRQLVKTLGADHFAIQVDDTHETWFWINIGLNAIELVVSGRYKAKVLWELANFCECDKK